MGGRGRNRRKQSRSHMRLHSIGGFDGIRGYVTSYILILDYICAQHAGCMEKVFTSSHSDLLKSSRHIHESSVANFGTGRYNPN